VRREEALYFDMLSGADAAGGSAEGFYDGAEEEAEREAGAGGGGGERGGGGDGRQDRGVRRRKQ